MRLSALWQLCGSTGAVLSPEVSTSRHVPIISLCLRQRTQNCIECAEQQKHATFGASSLHGWSLICEVGRSQHITSTAVARSFFVNECVEVACSTLAVSCVRVSSCRETVMPARAGFSFCKHLFALAARNSRLLHADSCSELVRGDWCEGCGPCVREQFPGSLLSSLRVIYASKRPKVCNLASLTVPLS